MKSEEYIQIMDENLQLSAQNLDLGWCCGPVRGPEERHELRITWNKYIERKYKYSIGKRVLNVSQSVRRELT